MNTCVCNHVLLCRPIDAKQIVTAVNWWYPPCVLSVVLIGATPMSAPLNVVNAGHLDCLAAQTKTL